MLDEDPDTLIITDSKEDKYSRHRLISWWDQERLSNSRIMVIGIGALGNEVVKNLAQLGVGSLFLVDFDTVERSNLTRSILFRDEDDDLRKVDVAVKRAGEINPDVIVEGFHGDVIWDLGLGVYRRMDVVIGCLDNREARLAVNRACWKTSTPWIDGGIQELSGVVKVFIPPDGACYECGMSTADYQLLNLRYSCPLLRREDLIMGKVPTVATISSIIGGLQAQEALKLLHGMSDSAGKCFNFSGMANEMYSSEIQRKENCMSHETYDEIIELEKSATDISFLDLLEIDREFTGADDYGVVELDRELVTKLLCSACGHSHDKMMALGKVSVSDAACSNCDSMMEPRLTHHVRVDDDLAGVKLAEAGIPPFHVLPIYNEGSYHYYELSGTV